MFRVAHRLVMEEVLVVLGGCFPNLASVGYNVLVVVHQAGQHRARFVALHGLLAPFAAPEVLEAPPSNGPRRAPRVSRAAV